MNDMRNRTTTCSRRLRDGKFLLSFSYISMKVTHLKAKPNFCDVLKLDSPKVYAISIDK